ncbi:methylaspartate mutase [Streptomyces sp. H27-S2]|uniref:methylaspartate mutase n=1 Tax=Streptomyces antarcticus TaxID=2996458 RepID=UPI00226E664E|nr:methylaspartate mutase [Streptomyces sp. H27-S2]MCY0954271.1 methylaspartate mutase [Streptomyces sp. H27-S2]
MDDTDRFTAFVRRAADAGHLVVQHRMGFGELHRMRAGLRAVRDADATTVGTVTLDSYTRCHDDGAALRALRERPADLNGFPLLAHGVPAVRTLLQEVASADFPVQIRHGTPLPLRLLRAMAEAGADATEGGPVSYCLPYGRVPLARAVAEWSAGCELLAARPVPPHMETFGGCMLGQLCPPSLLVALSVLEAMFFREHGLRGVSLSYAQQVHGGQDLEALAALRRLAGERLSGSAHHIVLYTFMGVFPRTGHGSRRLLADSACLAVAGGAERLVVKTPAEAHRIPTVEENVAALAYAASVAEAEAEAETTTNAGAVHGAARVIAHPPTPPAQRPDPTAYGIYEEARTLLDATLETGDTVGACLVRAFARGILDVPYCLHPDNANRARATIDARGALRWSRTGAMPVTPASTTAAAPVTAGQLTELLTFNRRRFDLREPGRLYGSAS